MQTLRGVDFGSLVQKPTNAKQAPADRYHSLDRAPSDPRTHRRSSRIGGENRVFAHLVADQHPQHQFMCDQGRLYTVHTVHPFLHSGARVGLIPTRPVAPPSPFVGIEPLAAEPLLELLRVGGIRETINVVPSVIVMHCVAAAAQRQILAELMNLVVADALAGACRQHHLVRPIPVNGRRRQLALAAHRRTAA